MKSYCFNFILFFQLLYLQVSGQSLMFISASPGETLVLKYNYTPSVASWFVPGFDKTKPRSVNLTDMYGQLKKWNIRKYSDNAFISNFTHTNRLQIVGNNVSREFFLKITNVTTDDAGLYRCEIIIENMGEPDHVANSFIVQLKYIANLSITYDPPKPIYEGYPLRLCCLTNNHLSNETVRWYSEKQGLQKPQKNSKKTCLPFVNVNRNDSVVYICKADHEGQTVTRTSL
ncbi:unnamed protein product [Mytilus coruscus]|uniref:Ig-like domain-containing protein n=1 Tax=Mytilus coruscus TaxID=42192 RepID=A0A6J8DJ66_MYTCO|nr:unnamed protein product [Mytilus coruscus]